MPFDRLTEVFVCVFVFLSVFVLARAFFAPKNVSFAEQYKASFAAGRRKQRLLYTLLGAVGCTAIAYGVTGEAHLAALSAFGGLFVGNVLVRRHEEVRRRLLREQYAQSLITLASALQGGLSPLQALEDAVPSMPVPARAVFGEILRRTRTGDAFVQAADAVAKESGWDDLRSLVLALKIYDRTGCNLVEVLRHLFDRVCERENHRKYVQAETSEARVTAALLSFLPFCLMGAARVMAPDFMRPVFETPVGNAVLVLCVLMVIAGNYIVKKMVSSVAEG